MHAMMDALLCVRDCVHLQLQKLMSMQCRKRITTFWFVRRQFQMRIHFRRRRVVGPKPNNDENDVVPRATQEINRNCSEPSRAQR